MLVETIPIIQATIDLVRERLRAKWGSLRDCCTDANYAIRELLEGGIEFPDEVYLPSLERIRGEVVVNGESYPHEWIRIDGINYDPTIAQFAANPHEVEYCGESVDW